VFGLCKDEIDSDWFKNNLKDCFSLDVVNPASKDSLELQRYLDGRHLAGITDFFENEPDKVEELFETLYGKQTSPAPPPQPTLSIMPSTKEKIGWHVMSFFWWLFCSQKLVFVKRQNILL